MLPAIELVSMNNLASVHKERITNCRNSVSTKSIRDAALRAIRNGESVKDIVKKHSEEK